MTILPKKKVDHIVHKSDSDSDSECCCAKCLASSAHPPSRSEERPNSHHRRRPEEFSYEAGASCPSPEIQQRSKRPHGASPGPKLTGEESSQWRWELESSTTRQSGYNSSEEYESRSHCHDLESEQIFEQAMKKDCGYIVKKMKNDGACLFRAVADQVYGDQDWHSVVRNQCLDYMIKNSEFFTQFITEDFDAYINRKRNDGCHGNHLEMQAMAELYNRTIEVYQSSTEPINIFHGMYKTDNAPIRLSYHQNNHYNSVVDPYSATVGVGLGLAGHKPGHADKLHLESALRESESSEIEKAMLEDKLKSTDWDATFNSIEEAVARESYLLWLKEQEDQQQLKEKGECSSVSKRSSSNASSGLFPAPHKVHSTSSHKEKTAASQVVTPPNNVPLVELSKKPIVSKYTTCINKASSQGSLCDSSSSKMKSQSTESGAEHSSKVTYRQATSSNRPDRSRSPWLGASRSCDSQPNSPSCGHKDVGIDKSSEGSGDILKQSCSSGSRSSGKTSPVIHTRSNLPSQRHSPYGQSSNIAHHSGSSSPKDKNSIHDPLDSPTAKQLLAAALALSPKSSPQHSKPSVTNSPSTSLPASPINVACDYTYQEDNVLSAYPFEYSSFQDLPPAAFGLSEWEDDRLLAAVLAASQQEYIESLKQGHNTKD